MRGNVIILKRDWDKDSETLDEFKSRIAMAMPRVGTYLVYVSGLILPNQSQLIELINIKNGKIIPEKEKIKYPEIKKCKNGEKKIGSDINICRKTSGFIIDPIYNQNHEIIEYEVECPWCGTIWWIPEKGAKGKPKLYKKYSD